MYKVQPEKTQNLPASFTCPRVLAAALSCSSAIASKTFLTTAKRRVSCWCLELGRLLIEQLFSKVSIEIARTVQRVGQVDLSVVYHNSLCKAISTVIDCRCGERLINPVIFLAKSRAESTVEHSRQRSWRTRSRQWELQWINVALGSYQLPCRHAAERKWFSDSWLKKFESYDSYCFA